VNLLRILQDKEFQRLGSNQTLKTDVRVIAATHRNLEEAIQRGLFREDLYYRLNVISISSLPSMREEEEDIPLLIDHFLKKYSEKNQKSISHISKEANALLLRYHYPGNVRELENTIESILVINSPEVIDIQHLSQEIRDSKGRLEVIPIRIGTPLEEVEKEIIGLKLSSVGTHEF
jgi:Nif-specific regulatory protein